MPKITKDKAIGLCTSIGTAHGQIECVMYLFSGATDNDAIIAHFNKLCDEDETTFDQIRGKAVDRPQTGYPPTHVALTGGLMDVDSPYGEYLDLCDAYEDAFVSAWVEQVKTVVEAIRAGMM